MALIGGMDHVQSSIVRTTPQPTPATSGVPNGQAAPHCLTQATWAVCEPYGRSTIVLRASSGVMGDGLCLSTRAMRRALRAGCCMLVIVMRPSG